MVFDLNLKISPQEKQEEINVKINKRFDLKETVDTKASAQQWAIYTFGWKTSTTCLNIKKIKFPNNI